MVWTGVARRGLWLSESLTSIKLIKKFDDLKDSLDKGEGGLVRLLCEHLVKTGEVVHTTANYPCSTSLLSQAHPSAPRAAISRLAVPDSHRWPNHPLGLQ